jgi:hypothetical protein
VITKLANWLLNSDEKLLSIIPDEQARAKCLTQLYRSRINYYLLLWGIIVLIFLAMFLAPDFSVRWLTLLLVMAIFGYLDIDTKIRAIRLYQLLSTQENPKE